jgi:hypothetical protein
MIAQFKQLALPSVGRVLAYYALPGEIDPMLLLATLDESIMVDFVPQSPSAALPTVEYDLILIPCLGYTADGYRLLVSQADIDLWKMRTGRLKDDDDFQRIGHAMGMLAEAPIFIDDSGSANIMEIRTKARRLQSEHKALGLIVIDYLQLMESRGSENRTQEVSEITRGLKSIARELNVPVLALSQLSRSVEQDAQCIPETYILSFFIYLYC